MTYEATSSAISSPVSEAGAPACELQDGPMIDLFGQALCHASPTASLQSLMAERKASAITGISGRFSSPSPASCALQGSMASRLQQLLSGDGGTAQPWTLRAKDTPLRRAYCEVTPVAQTTKGSGSTGWPTPAARDGKDISRSNAFLSQRLRHSPSMATRLLGRGESWQAITLIYCLAMGYPSQWNDARPKDTVTPSSRKSRPSL